MKKAKAMLAKLECYINGTLFHVERFVLPDNDPTMRGYVKDISLYNMNIRKEAIDRAVQAAIKANPYIEPKDAEYFVICKSLL